jgi:hypothetical protein
MVGFPFSENGMECDHDRHLQFPQLREIVNRRPTPIDAELVLQAHHVNVADVEEVSGA